MKKKKSPVWHYESRNLPRSCLACFLLTIYCWACSLHVRVVYFSSETFMEKNILYLQFGDCFWVRDGCVCPLLLSVLGAYLVQTSAGSVSAILTADLCRPCACCLDCRPVQTLCRLSWLQTCVNPVHAILSADMCRPCACWLKYRHMQSLCMLTPIQTYTGPVHAVLVSVGSYANWSC